MKEKLGMNRAEFITAYPQNLRSLVESVKSHIPELDANIQAIRGNGGSRREYMEGLLAKLLWGQLQSMGMFLEINATITSLKQKSGINSLFGRWLDETLDYLARKQFLSRDGMSCFVADPSPVDIDKLWLEWEKYTQLWLQQPNMKSQVVLVDATLKSLPDILKGKTLATDILFPEASMRLVEGIYKNNDVSDFFNEVLVDTVVAYLRERLSQDPFSKIRILEVGAGTGGTTSMLLPKLAPYQAHIAEYCYTDISRAFLMHAENEYRSIAPYLTCKIFNVESPIAGQDIEAGSYDLVIASNVLHATKNIRQTLRNAKAVLKCNGLLLLNEISRNDLFTHLTFGLLEGWWLYEDISLRIPGCPGLYPEIWQEVLEKEGFRAVYYPAQEAKEFGQQIIVAESNGVVRQKRNEDIFQGVRNKKQLASFEYPHEVRSEANSQSSETKGVSLDSLKERSTAFFKKLVADTLKTQVSKIDASEPLEEYGIDSILVVQLTHALRKTVDNVSSTLFFECQTINALVEHFIKYQRESLNKLVGLEGQQAKTLPISTENMHAEKSPANLVHYHIVQRNITRPALNAKVDESALSTNLQDIAVIGLSGRYPKSDNVHTFWENLKEGRNCITEVPEERWNWREYFDKEKGKSGKIYAKWGGFIDDADKFDPLFFQISPAEAEKIDPQERLFLETVYAAIEDAGYAPHKLCESRKVGVFVGVMNSTYPGETNYWSIANRISYFLNINGPSMAVDTACSSSLTAIHLALESLYSGTSDCAIAGGVNLVVNPAHYLRLSSMTMLSPSKECKAYGAGADGFVDGEGVGAIVLKPLQKAIADGDHIHGIIKGSMLNSGGKTNGYTVPNPTAQFQLISDTLRRAGVDARTISYIEGHGTGTALGDPIEIAALSKAFSNHTHEKQFCAIGSVKTNIGHCESAAGIAGVTKVLLQFKHGKLAPSLHSDMLNPEIDFTKTPFVVQQQLADWLRPLIEVNGEVREYPRRAGISSFGAGGANAHLILEEYISLGSTQASEQVNESNPVIILLSAKNEDRLKAQARQLLSVFSDRALINSQLKNIAYTLQIGREAMEVRLGMLVTSSGDLIEKLERFVEGESESDDCFVGNVKNNKETLSFFTADDDIEKLIETWMTKGKYLKLLDIWVKGLTVDWSFLYKNYKPKRVSLPTYPFDKKRYWISSYEQMLAVPKPDAKQVVTLHPLLHQNTSNFSGQQYTTIFSGEEFYFVDHKVQGKKIFPGVCYLEMAHAAVKHASALEGEMVTLKNVIWARPFIFSIELDQIYVKLHRLQSGDIEFEVFSNSEANGPERILHSHGLATVNKIVPLLHIDLESIKSQCQDHILKSYDVYDKYNSMGIEYGPGHQGIEKVFVGKNKVLAKLKLPSCVAYSLSQFRLHPSLLDSALQATLGFMTGSEHVLDKPILPFSLQSIEELHQCEHVMWALLSTTNSSGQNATLRMVDVDLCDDKGKVCIRLRGLTSRQLQGELSLVNKVGLGNIKQSYENKVGTLELIPVWNTFSVGKCSEPLDEKENILIFAAKHSNREELIKNFPCGKILGIEPEASIDEIVATLKLYEPIGHILWIADTALQSFVADIVIDEQKGGVIQCFRIIKALLQLGYGSREISWDVVTTQTQSIREKDPIIPTHASVHGLFGSLAKEFPRWKIRLVDLEEKCALPIREMLMLPVEPNGNIWGYRAHEWYRQQLIPSNLQNEWGSLYKKGGVYVVVGGAGGIGGVWSEYMIRTYQAQIIWIGRRDKDELIQAKQEFLSKLGPMPFYIKADATKSDSLKHAYDEIKRKYERVNGVIHSAIVLLDGSISKMEEVIFTEGLSAKVDICIRIAQTFSQEALDFVLFFSSMNSFSKLAGQGNYASGCTFKDAFAHRLAQEWICPVKVVNWGYWGGVGVVASKDYQDRMAQAGIGSIEPQEGMRALERLLAAPVRQIGLIKTTKPNVVSEMSHEENIQVSPRRLSSTLSDISRKFMSRESEKA